jgi:hypothetical protein
VLGVLGFATGAVLFGSEDPLAPVGRGEWHHRGLTVAAARAAGFTAAAAEMVALPAVAVDLYLNHPFWVLSGGRRRVVGAWLGRGPLQAVHFDDLGSLPEIERTWQRITGGTLAGLDWCRRTGDVDSARHLLGLGLHAVQDFYSHSNWIDDPARRDTTWLAATGHRGPDLWTASVGSAAAGGRPPHGGLRLTPAAVLRVPGWLPDAVRGGLRRTAAPARRRLPRGLRTAADGINLDSRWQAEIGVATRGLADLSGEQAFELARELARRESVRWLALLAERVTAAPAGAAFWQRVRTAAPGRSWERAFDDPGRLPYGFLTVGDGSGDGTGWFLRVQVTSRGPAPRTVLAGGRLAHLPRPGGARPGGARARTAYLGPYAALPAALEVTGRPMRVEVTGFRRAPEGHSVELADERPPPSGRVVIRPEGAG